MQSELLNKFVIVRTYSAGVHAGILVAKDGKEVALARAYRLWYWAQANQATGSLSGIAEFGVSGKSKIAGPVARIELTEAIEIIQTSAGARATIESGKWNT